MAQAALILGLGFHDSVCDVSAAVLVAAQGQGGRVSDRPSVGKSLS